MKLHNCHHTTCRPKKLYVSNIELYYFRHPQPHQQQQYDKYGLINNPAYAIDNALKKNSQPLPAIMAPNTGAIQPWNGNGVPSDSEDEFLDDNRKMELEYKGNNQNNHQALEVAKPEKETTNSTIENNKKNMEVENKKNNAANNTTSSTTSNNGVIKVSMVGEIAMSNFHNHQCK